MLVIMSLIMFSDFKHRQSPKQFVNKSVATLHQCKWSRTKESILCSARLANMCCTKTKACLFVCFSNVDRSL